MKIKKTLIALLTILTFAFGMFTLHGCSSETIVSSPKKHSVSVSSTEECIISVDKTKAEFAETVTVTLDLKTTDKYVEKVTYNGKEASKRSETVYDFLMGNDDVTVAVELKEYQQLLISPNGFATYLTGNPDTLAKKQRRSNAQRILERKLYDYPLLGNKIDESGGNPRLKYKI